MTITAGMHGTQLPKQSTAHALTVPLIHEMLKATPTQVEHRQLARRLGFDIVTGYVEHDRGRLDSSIDAFSRVYQVLFPDVGISRVRNAAEVYVDVLVKQDEIENQKGRDKAQIIADPRWEDIKSLLLKFSHLLDLPESYAEQTTNLYRYHGVGDDRYVKYCLESDKIFTTRVIGVEYWSKILGALYLILIECHDKHDSTGLDVGLRFAARYFEIILASMSTRLQELVPPITQ